MPRSRKQNRLLLIAVVMIATNSATVVAAEKKHPEKMHPGQKNFEEFCASCHGYDGTPVLPGTPNFTIGERLNKKDNELLQAIRKGKGEVMPPWDEVLNKQAQQDVLNYITHVIHTKNTKKN